MRGIFFLAVLASIWGMWALRSVDLFGLDAVIRHQNAEPSAAKPFTVKGPYRWVRHPLYLLTLVFFWSYPVITTDRLLFNILWTLWVVIGARLEERELVEDFGDDYRDYQSKVPMLLPRSIRPVYL
jgi:protein-S-isoprenylcysteine O-methyltransferase Ste14